MERKEQIMHYFKGALGILERILVGKSIPFKIVDTMYTEERGPHALIDLQGERFFVAPTIEGAKLWIADFPIKNTDGSSVPPGFLGFPTEVAAAVEKYYNEKPKGNVQNVSLPGELGTINLNEIIKEEVRKVFEADYDYAAQEREYTDKQYYQEDEAAREAMISSALSFMQDVQGSEKKLTNQKQLSGTTPEVDKHLSEAINHINQAIESYFNTLSPDIKEDVSRRLGEIKIQE
jgi:hypothetical protein